jgi:hypothetical protein
MNFVFPNSWDDDPIWLSYFSEGLKPPTIYIYIYKYESYGYNMDNNMDNILFTIYYGYTIYNVI